MGREIRKVPSNWEHPKNRSGNYQPMYETFYEDAAQEWIKNFNEFIPSEFIKYYWENELPPDEEYCVPYRKEDAIWFQVYETVSEGTPVTPPFETEQQLIDHLCTYGESLIGKYNSGPFSREIAEKFVLKNKWVMSGLMSGGEIIMGINTVSKT